MRLVRVLAVIVALGSAVAAQTGQASRTGGGACRTGVASYRIVTRAAITSTVNGSCTFDAAAIEGTCTNDYSDSTGRTFRSVSTTRHASVADVVAEVSVNPPLQRALGTTTTVTGAGVDSVNASTLEYDAQKRLISVTAESRPSGQRSTTTYTAWDAAGRPTMATLLSGRQSTTQSISYDDARRTQSITSGGVTCTQSFDENGNPSAGSCGGATASTTILTTQRICR